MSYYIDKKYTYLKQFSEVAEKLKNEITTYSSKSNNALLASKNAMNQNIQTAKEGKESIENDLKRKYNESLSEIDFARNRSLSSAKETYEQKLDKAKNDYHDKKQN